MIRKVIVRFLNAHDVGDRNHQAHFTGRMLNRFPVVLPKQTEMARMATIINLSVQVFSSEEMVMK